MAFLSVTANGEQTSIVRAIAEEAPVAIEVNGIGYAVLMTTGADLEDLAFGFALTERLIDRADQLLDVDIHGLENGSCILRLTLAEDRIDRALDRVRHRTSDSSCGLCGIENLEQAMRPLPRLPAHPAPASAAIFRALAMFRDHQPLVRETGATHAAALCDGTGDILIVREDVGRHNAFDKLIGAMLRANLAWGDGFALLSSRCSYELVEKAILSACPALITISAPTSLAISRAAEAGLHLVVLARSDAILRSIGQGSPS